MRLIFLAIFFFASGTSHALNELCEKGESTYFSCNIGKKIVSLCASKGLSPTSGYLQYRFGTIKNIEFNYPAQKAHPNGIFFHSGAVYSGGVDTRLSFSNGAYKYVVYSTLTALGAQTWEHVTESGVAILKNGNLIKDMSCIKPDDFRTAYPEGIFQREEYEDLFSAK